MKVFKSGAMDSSYSSMTDGLAFDTQAAGTGSRNYAQASKANNSSATSRGLNTSTSAGQSRTLDQETDEDSAEAYENLHLVKFLVKENLVQWGSE